MKRLQALITHYDMESLQFLLSQWKEDVYPELKRRLTKAKVVPGKTIPAETVTIYSKVRIRDMATGNERVWRIVLPKDENFRQGRISVTRPFGAVLLGSSVGDVVEWMMISPKVTFRMKVVEMLYQPERYGQFNLK